MQDETVGQVVALCIQGGKVTEQALKQAVRETLAQMERQACRKGAEKGQSACSGKQSLKKLRMQGCSLSSIEVTDGNIRSFERYARKYDVDYCLKKDRSSSPPRCYVFFKAGDVDAVTAAFKEYAGRQAEKEKRESVHEKLALARERAGKRSERGRTKKKTREQSL